MGGVSYDEVSTAPAQGWCPRHRYRGEKVALDDPIGYCGVPLYHSSQRHHGWPL